MAIIKDFLGYILKIDQTSQAARITPYNTDGTLIKTMDGVNATYSASITALVVANSGTDFFTITGSSTKTVRILKIQISGTATSAAVQNINVIKRSTVNETGTSTTLTNVPYDSSSSAATAVVKAYTANPGTLGTSIGQIASPKLFLSTVSTECPMVTLLFGDREGKSIVLNAATELLCLNYNAATQSGNSMSVSIEWVEE